MKSPQYKFMECAMCAAKPGSPVLCNACLHNRNTISEMNEIIARSLELVEKYRAENKTLWKVLQMCKGPVEEL